MNCPYFIGPWKGLGAAIAECAEETGHSVAHLLRMGADRLLQEYYSTGRVRASAAIPEPRAGRPARASKERKAAAAASLDALSAARNEAREEVNQARAAWVQFGLAHGEQGKERARNGGPGIELWLCLKHAIERERAAVEKLAEARLALTSSGRT